MHTFIYTYKQTHEVGVLYRTVFLSPLRKMWFPGALPPNVTAVALGSVLSLFALGIIVSLQKITIYDLGKVLGLLYAWYIWEILQNLFV